MNGSYWELISKQADFHTFKFQFDVEKYKHKLGTVVLKRNCIWT